MQSNLNNLKFIRQLIFFSFFFLTTNTHTIAQVLIDEIAGIVGENIILKSDIEQQVLQYKAQGLEQDSALDSQVLEDLLFQKLLLHKASIDSVVVTENEVLNEIDSRLDNFIMQLGSEEQLEAYFDKKIYEIKEEMFEPIESSLLIQRVRYSISSSVDITPAEVRSFYNSFDVDSLPKINDRVQVAQILKRPPASSQAIEETRSKLEKLKERVLKGENFATLAILYSEDPGSSRNGGLYNGLKRGMFVKEFEAVMYSLEEGEISDVFETEYGYHIVQLEERRGDEVDVRHILMSPKISPVDLNNSKELLEEVRDSILAGDLSFNQGALNHSDDKLTKQNGGLLMNIQKGDSFFEMHELENSVRVAIEGLSEGDITNPVYVKMDDGSEAYRIFILLANKEAHTANLKDDYKAIYDLALQDKKNKAIEEWVNDILVKTYVMISDSYKNYTFQYNWVKN